MKPVKVVLQLQSIDQSNSQSINPIGLLAVCLSGYLVTVVYYIWQRLHVAVPTTSVVLYMLHCSFLRAAV